MAIFLFGVVVGWIGTFALWFIWSFSLISGLLLGTLIGTAVIFAHLLIQLTLRDLNRKHKSTDVPAGENRHPDPERVAFRH